VRVVLHDAQGNLTSLRHGADFDYFSDRGSVQWQTRLRFGGPAAIVSVRDDGPVNVRVVANRPGRVGPAAGFVRSPHLAPGRAPSPNRSGHISYGWGGSRRFETPWCASIGSIEGDAKAGGERARAIVVGRRHSSPG
jgi:hypothetical protein